MDREILPQKGVERGYFSHGSVNEFAIRRASFPLYKVIQFIS